MSKDKYVSAAVHQSSTVARNSQGRGVMESTSKWKADALQYTLLPSKGTFHMTFFEEGTEAPIFTLRSNHRIPGLVLRLEFGQNAKF